MRPVLAYKLIVLRMIAEENKTQKEVARSRINLSVAIPGAFILQCIQYWRKPRVMIKHLSLFSISYKPAKGELWLDFCNKMFCVKKASMQIF